MMSRDYMGPEKRVVRNAKRNDFLALVWKEEQELRKAILNSLKDCHNDSLVTPNCSKLLSSGQSPSIRPTSLAFSCSSSKKPNSPKTHVKSSFTNSIELLPRLKRKNILSPITPKPRTKLGGLQLKSPIARLNKKQFSNNLDLSDGTSTKSELFLSPHFQNTRIPSFASNKSVSKTLTDYARTIYDQIVYSDNEKDGYSVLNNTTGLSSVLEDSSEDEKESISGKEHYNDSVKSNSFSNGLNSVRYPDQPEIITVLNMSSEAVPPQLWQDFNGKPANVHEFIDFMSRQGLYPKALDNRLSWYSIPPHQRPIKINKNNSTLANRHLCVLGSTQNLFKSAPNQHIASVKTSSLPKQETTDTTPGERLLNLVASVQHKHPTASFTINEHGHGCLKVSCLAVAKKNASYVYPGQDNSSYDSDSNVVILDQEVCVETHENNNSYRPSKPLPSNEFSSPSTIHYPRGWLMMNSQKKKDVKNMSNGRVNQKLKNNNNSSIQTPMINNNQRKRKLTDSDEVIFISETKMTADQTISSLNKKPKLMPPLSLTQNKPDDLKRSNRKTIISGRLTRSSNQKIRSRRIMHLIE